MLSKASQPAFICRRVAFRPQRRSSKQAIMRGGSVMRHRSHCNAKLPSASEQRGLAEPWLHPHVSPRAPAETTEPALDAVLPPLPRGSLARWLTGALALVVAAWKAAPARAEGSLPVREFVYDATNLLAPSTRKYLDKLLRRLQEETGLKARVICPPAGLQEERTAFRDFLRPINKEWGIDASSIVILAEERVQKRWGRTLPLFTVQPGYKLQERFQYRLSQDFVMGVADVYGSPQYFQAKGTDQAIQEATENVVAALFDLVDNRSARYFNTVPEEEVRAILKRHGL